MRLIGGRYVVKTLADAKRLIRFAKNVKEESSKRAQTPHAVTGSPSWHFVDAKNMVTGRLAPKITELLMGKNKPTYNPRHDNGDYVVVVNASKTKLTGRKQKEKIYYWHTGHPGGLKKKTPAQLQDEESGAEVLRKAVSGMLPKNKLRKHREKRLILFPDAESHGLFEDVIKERKPLWFHAEFSGSDLDEFASASDGGEWESLPEISVEEVKAWLDANPMDKDFNEIFEAINGGTRAEAVKKE